MTLNIIELLIVLLGLAITPILFYRIPRISKAKNEDNRSSLSVIIPARNEGKILPLLLEDLRVQSSTPFEIICADDESSDDTAQIAASFGARVVSLADKPDGWMGKTWACQNGADLDRFNDFSPYPCSTVCFFCKLALACSLFSAVHTLGVGPFHPLKESRTFPYSADNPLSNIGYCTFCNIISIDG